MPAENPWYATGFDADYPLMQTYEESITELQALSVEHLLRLGPRARILDLCCGYGRHSRVWRKKGLDPVGLDLSADLLEIARRDQPRGRWIRGDVRHLPFPAKSFEAAALMFVSFGYFPTAAEDQQALREAARVLVPGGRIYLDIKNPANLRANPFPDAAMRIGGADVTETSRIVPSSEGERYEIRRTLRYPGQPLRSYYYSVRLYEPDEIARQMEKAGFGGIQLYGGYDARPLTPEEKRLIVTGRRDPESPRPWP